MHIDYITIRGHAMVDLALQGDETAITILLEAIGGDDDGIAILGQDVVDRLRMASADVYGAYGRHSVAMLYEELEPGLHRRISWLYDGQPRQEADLQEAWRAEVLLRLPDAEHGARWI